MVEEMTAQEQLADIKSRLHANAEKIQEMERERGERYMRGDDMASFRRQLTELTIEREDLTAAQELAEKELDAEQKRIAEKASKAELKKANTAAKRRKTAARKIDKCFRDLAEAWREYKLSGEDYCRALQKAGAHAPKPAKLENGLFIAGAFFAAAPDIASRVGIARPDIEYRRPLIERETALLGDN